MASPWTVAPASDPVRIARAHEASIVAKTPAAGIRRLVRDSWLRSLALDLDPDTAPADLVLGEEALGEYRSGHPLAMVLPTVQRLLVRHTFDTGLIVAVGDAGGRLLWIDGDRMLRRKAEGMLFVEGADWSEGRAGTSAPGTALALDQAVQIQRAEHFNRTVHPWSCTAVPVHDPSTGTILGVIDITGGDDAVAPQTMPLIEATVAAVEAELRLRQLDDRAGPVSERPRPTSGPESLGSPRVESRSARAQPTSRSTITAPLRHIPVSLRGLGRDNAELEIDDRRLELSPRHAEILTLLAWHRSGLTAERMSELLYRSDAALVTLRAEMVRLRRVMEGFAPEVSPTSRPYALGHPIELDAQRVLSFLDRGAHRVALAAYAGPLLPSSDAPGIREIRSDVSTRLRDAMLTGGSVDTLLAYARTDDAAYDSEVWRACLRLLPARSPKRVAVVARIERIEKELMDRV